MLGLASNGLHTNGYSLARKILFEKMRLKPAREAAGLQASFGEELLRVHNNYQPLLARVPRGMIKGLAHITGGGLIDNLPRVLPNDCDAVIDTGSLEGAARFSRSCSRVAGVDRDEMYQVFNMGIGMVAIVRNKRRRGNWKAIPCQSHRPNRAGARRCRFVIRAGSSAAKDLAVATHALGVRETVSFNCEG